MPKPIIGNAMQQKTKLDLSLSSTLQKRMTPMQLERRLRADRSSGYIEKVKMLDAGGHTDNRHQVDAIIEAIRNELPEVPLENLPVGIVAKCYLGNPFEVHTLDLSGMIIKHYKEFEPLPALLEKARGLSLCGCYEFVEVYYDCIRAIKSNGTVSVVKD
ncbi:MAG: hypothetical protein DDT19_02822 [Syntrophomonadaceae bacterium]|nr:hypothetical protein [Bacillota bacterium]